jgi:hypothetical protein
MFCSIAVTRRSGKNMIIIQGNHSIYHSLKIIAERLYLGYADFVRELTKFYDFSVGLAR